MSENFSFYKSKIFDFDFDLDGLYADHLLLTRFGIGITDSHWLDFRIKLFKAITLPSIISQKSNRLVWLIFIDSAWPEYCKEEIRNLTNCHPYIKIIELEFYFEYYLFASKIIEKSISKFSSCFVSKIDDDDAIALGTFDAIYSNSSEWFVYTFPYGNEFLCQERVLREVKMPFLTMNTHFHMRSLEDVVYIKIGHHNVESYATKQQRKIVFDEVMKPAWLYSRHKQSDSRFAAVRKSILQDSFSRTINAKYYARYSINFDYLQEFREFSSSAASTADQKTWLKQTELNSLAEKMYMDLSRVREEIKIQGSDIFDRNLTS